MDSFLKDLKHSVGAFLGTPSFTITALAALALGIGTNTAIFSVVNAVLLKPVRAPQPDRVVAFMSKSREGASSAASEIKFNLWREQTSSFQDVSGYYVGSLNLTNIDQPQRAVALFVTIDYFRLFGLPIAYGRGFTAEEEQPNGSNAVILSDALWKRSFGGDSRVLGRTVSLSGISYQVVGIMAPGLQTETPEPPDIWLPFPVDPNSTNQGHYFQAAGRLKHGITLATANAQLELTTREFRREFPNSLSTSRRDVFSVEPMRDVLVHDVRSSLLILAAAVSLVLLIACVNVANLSLIRASARQREIAIRLAVGASTRRIIRQLLTESALLALAGGVLGLVFGMAGIHTLLALAPSNLPRVGIKGANVTLDWRVLGFTVLMALLTGLLFGLLPALQASRADLNTALKAHRETAPGRSYVSIRSLFVVAEMSLALLLLLGAVLFIRTLLALHSVNPGFDPSNVVTTHTSLDPRTAKKAGVDEIVRDVFRRLGALSGVESAGFTRLLPLEGGFNSLPIIIASRPLTGPSHGSVRWMVVSSSYFNVLKIPLLRGRLFTDADRLGAPGVAIINEAMAREFWPGDPLGRAPLEDRLFIGRGLPNFEEPARQIVGIVGDVHDNGLDEPPQPAVFIPGAQLTDPRNAGRPVAWVIRTRTRSASLNSAILNELREATREPVPPLRSMREIASKSTSRQRFNMLLMSIFGASALLLAAIGIYGLMAYSVQQRTHEVGIRMAIGARSGEVRSMVVLQGMRLALAGIGIGIAAAFGLTRFIAAFLFGVKALDPLTFILVSILLSGVALVAVWLPAQRASRVDPIHALRHE